MTKGPLLKTLDEKTFRWLEIRKTLRLPGRPTKQTPEEGASEQQMKARRRQKLFRIRAVALKEISDLTRLAKLLPEDQLRQVFTEEQLLPLFSAIFNLGEKPPIEEELLEKKRKRLLPICNQNILLLDDYHFSEPLAGPIRTVTAAEGGSLPGVRAIYYRSMMPEKKGKVTDRSSNAARPDGRGKTERH
jgi:hypothetical protein